MHNRDMIWNTADGRSLKIREITSVHLTNILHHIETNKKLFEEKYGETKIKKSIFNIEQEIRLRKLNRIESSNNNEQELF